MRASNDYFDDFDDAGFRQPPRLQRMIDEQRRRVKRLKAASRSGPGSEWDSDWDDADDFDDEYPDYNEEEFDRYNISR